MGRQPRKIPQYHLFHKRLRSHIRKISHYRRLLTSHSLPSYHHTSGVSHLNPRVLAHRPQHLANFRPPNQLWLSHHWEVGLSMVQSPCSSSPRFRRHRQVQALQVHLRSHSSIPFEAISTTGLPHCMIRRRKASTVAQLFIRKLILWLKSSHTRWQVLCECNPQDQD